ncbi:MAG: DUF4340 domain-containing protein [Kiritimatiellae bacterium]|nr:DUF4340 domain-containing protein [Kiritimatiellia bacterium]MDD5520824.1 DUF4340 domain-containing protein [Kiritimatiellia bacterium]
MRFSITLRLIAAVCVLAILIFIFDREKPVKEKTSLLGITAADVSEIRIERGDFSARCFRKGESWFVAEPIQARADDSKIDGIVGVLETLSRQETITYAERTARKLTMKDYGLHKPRVKLVVSGKHGTEEFREEIFIGQDSPLGDSLYVKLGTNDDVVATARGIMTVIPEKIEAIRDRMVLHGDASKTSRIEIKRAGSGFVQLAHLTANDWFIQQPIVARADSARIQQILGTLYSMQVIDFVWDANVETGDVARAVETATGQGDKMESYRLTPDQAVVGMTVWSKGNEIGREMFFGKDAGEKSDKVYVRCKDIDSIYTVPKNIMDVLNVGVNDLRDRNLFFLAADNVNYVFLQKGDRKLALAKKEKEGWTIVEPVQWKADDRFVNEMVGNITRLRVDSFLSGTNSAVFDFDMPACIIGVSDRLPNVAEVATNKLEKLQDKTDEVSKVIDLKQGRLLVSALREEQNALFVRFEEEPYILEVARTAFDFLGKDPVDPLIYRDRTMLSIDPGTVRRISLLKGGAEQTIERNETGKWTVLAPGTNQVDVKVVDDILFAVANMRAIRTECQNPENLVQYGLDHSGTTLTFGLTGEKGIQKTLVMGFRAKLDGIYTLVQGLDVVFVISNEMMDLLTKDLTKSLPALP